MIIYQNGKLTISSENNFIIFDGVIDEEFIHKNLQVFSNPVLKINLKGLKKINSCGIRELIAWLNSLSPNQQVYYEEAPIFFIHQANIVNSIVAPNRKILSFYCPYFDEKHNLEVQKLVHLDDLKNFKAPLFDGLIFDSAEEKYFYFLRMQSERS
jgi:hypothetical protein